MGSGAAILTYLLISLRKSTRIKLLDYCSIGFFLALLLVSISYHGSWIALNIRYLSNGYLALVILVSILMKSPFTLAYAKEVTPKEKWGTQAFYNINLLISMVWFLFFIFSLLIQPLSYAFSFAYIDLQICFLVFAISISKKLPEWYIHRMKNR